MPHLWLFLSGLLLANAVPHLAAGLRGESFPTPFARPRGRAPSPPLVNAAWGLANLALGLWLAQRGGATAEGTAPWVVLVGFACAAMFLAWRFGAVRRSGSF